VNETMRKLILVLVLVLSPVICAAQKSTAQPTKTEPVVMEYYYTVK
jgi:hypothetical protein